MTNRSDLAKLLRRRRVMIPDILATISFCLAVFLLVHQQLATNVWFTWQQFWHHEPLIACGLVAAIALLIGKYVGRL